MRLLVLSAENKYCQITFDVYGLMLYYAKKLNVENTLILYKSTKSEYWFKKDLGLPLGNLSDNDEWVNISSAEVNLIVSFIDDQIIPQLINESVGLLKKFGGSQNFISLFEAEPDYGEYIILDEDFQEEDADIYSQSSIIKYFEYLRDFLRFVKNNDEPYKSFVKS